MNITIYVDKILSLYQNAFSKLDEQAKAKADALTSFQKAAVRLSEQAAKEEYNNLLQEHTERLRAIVEKLNESVAAVEAEFLQELKTFYTPNGDAINAADQTLLSSGILKEDEVSALITKHAENPTMLRIIGRYTAEIKLTLSAADTRAIYRAASGGESEKRIFKTFKQLIHAPVIMAEQGQAGTEAFLLSALNAEEYAQEAKAKLLRSKTHLNEADRSTLEQIEAKQIEEKNKKYDPQNIDYGWYNG
ncbi:MAG: hypothetical protein IJY74_00190 [Oscillospiraceae bacterium]|nr:hypothetical protein [Oscillospiraceae bacterium]